MKAIAVILITLGSIILFGGLLFRVMYWPFAYPMILSGVLLLGIGIVLHWFGKKASLRDNESLDSGIVNDDD